MIAKSRVIQHMIFLKFKEDLYRRSRMLFVGDVSRKDPRSVNYLPEISRIISSEHQFSHDFHLLSHSVSSPFSLRSSGETQKRQTWKWNGT